MPHEPPGVGVGVPVVSGPGSGVPGACGVVGVPGAVGCVVSAGITTSVALAVGRPAVMIVAWMVTFPGFTPRAFPVASMIAIVSLLDFQSTPADPSDPPPIVKRTVA